MAILTRIAYCCDLSPLYEATMEGGGGEGLFDYFRSLKRRDLSEMSSFTVYEDLLLQPNEASRQQCAFENF